jgi:hypothetical protein
MRGAGARESAKREQNGDMVLDVRVLRAAQAARLANLDQSKTAPHFWKVTLKSHLKRCRTACAGAVCAAAKFTVFASAAGFETLRGGWLKGLKDTKGTHGVALKCIFCRLNRRNCAVGFLKGKRTMSKSDPVEQ